MISYKEFLQSCHHFLKIADTIGDDWKSASDTEEHNFYLIKSRHCFSSLDQPASSTNTENLELLMSIEEEPSEDPLCLCNSRVINETYVAELHVVYSVAYCVPVFYFNIWDNSGKLLVLEEVWNFLSKLTPSILKDKWQTLSQSDHPIKGTPFYYFHPCNTSETMQYLMKRNSSSGQIDNLKHYIPNWLGIYGSPLGLSVSLKYFLT